MSNARMNLILGPRMSGKTSLFRFLARSENVIKASEFINKRKKAYTLSKEHQLNCKNLYEKRVPQYFQEFCDFPRFEFEYFRSEEDYLNTLVELQYELQKFDKIRLILLIKKTHITKGKSAKMITIVREFINLFRLTEEDAKGIIIVVSKSTESFCKIVPNLLIGTSYGETNFLLEAIKCQEIRVLPFEESTMIGLNYQLSERNRLRLLQALKNTEYLDCIEYRQRVYEAIKSKLLSIKNVNEDYPSIMFTSKLNIGASIYSDLLCIDSMNKLTQELLMIKSPIIIVMPEEKNELIWEIEGKDPLITLSEEVEKVISGEKWVISTKNALNNIEFPNPESVNFSSSHQFFRLESIIRFEDNRWLYSFFNPKFKSVELIAYLNTAFGKVDINNDFKINKNTVDIKLQLYTSNYRGNSDYTMDRFLSIRACNNIDEYLEKCNKKNISSEIKQGLISNIIKLPSIFQLFMKSDNLSIFSEDTEKLNDLLKVKDKLIHNYEKLINDSKFLNLKLCENDKLFNAGNSFKKVFETKPKLKYKNYYKKKNYKSLIQNSKMNDEEFLDFFSFFDTVINSTSKIELFNYQITGDVSNYTNYQSFFNKKLNEDRNFTEFQQSFLNQVNCAYESNFLPYFRGLSLGAVRFPVKEIIVERSSKTIILLKGTRAFTGVSLDFIVGPKSSGKTTFCHFLSGSNLSIKNKGFKYIINSIDTSFCEPKFGFRNEEVKDYGRYIDFPGFDHFLGDQNSIEYLMQLENKLRQCQVFRLVLCVEKNDLLKSAVFTNILNNFVNLYAITRDDVRGIKFVVTKTNQSFCDKLPGYLGKLFGESINIIIDAIINGEIRVSAFVLEISFEKPGPLLQFNSESRYRMIEDLSTTSYIDSKKYMQNVSAAIDNKLKLIREDYKNNPNIIFTSKVNIKKELYSNFILCIDSDEKINQENLKIDTPNIVVLSEKDRKFNWEIKGYNPHIKFSKKIERVLNGENWIISTKNSSKITFPDPTKNNFNSNSEFFRLESVCVNGFWKENVSFNNQFLDLILYINPSFGKIEVKDSFRIKTLSIDIRLKLYLNECFRPKYNILEYFVSIRNCESIDSYLEKCNKSNINNFIKNALKDYVMKLPHIIQILNSGYLSEFYENDSEKNDLLEFKDNLNKYADSDDNAVFANQAIYSIASATSILARGVLGALGSVLWAGQVINYGVDLVRTAASSGYFMGEFVAESKILV